MQGAILSFANAKQNDATVGIGKSRICLPERARETPFGRLGLKLIMFSIFAELA